MEKQETANILLLTLLGKVLTKQDIIMAMIAQSYPGTPEQKQSLLEKAHLEYDASSKETIDSLLKMYQEQK